MAAGAREVEIVDGAATLNPGFHRRGQQIIGRIHIRKFSFPADLRHNFRIHHRCLPGALTPRAVSVPIQRPPIRVLAARIAVLVEVGQHVDFRVFPIPVILAQHVDLHLAEIAREGDLGCRRQIDVSE